MHRLQPVDDDHHPLLIATLPNTIAKGSNVLVIQRVLGTPFEVQHSLVRSFAPHLLASDHLQSNSSSMLRSYLMHSTPTSPSSPMSSSRKLLAVRIDCTWH